MVFTDQSCGHAAIPRLKKLNTHLPSELFIIVFTGFRLFTLDHLVNKVQPAYKTNKAFNFHRLFWQELDDIAGAVAKNGAGVQRDREAA